MVAGEENVYRSALCVCVCARAQRVMSCCCLVEVGRWGELEGERQRDGGGGVGWGGDRLEC